MRFGQFLRGSEHPKGANDLRAQLAVDVPRLNGKQLVLPLRLSTRIAVD
jgi:hypothetical protein